MSFDGDLEHLPIVDVIQLLHATGKSGTLTLRSLKGESQLVFHSGYIVSANHVNNSLRIGQVLMDMKKISYDDLEIALNEQRKAGVSRKPIVQTLVEAGKIKTEDAYQGLEVLIEMTIVEVLTWTRGTFSLEVEKLTVSDEYRYFPDKLQKELQLNTQNILMDALRIYDERKRDGTLGPEALFGATPATTEATTEESGHPELSAADLGLDDLESLERQVPTPFSGLADSEPNTPRFRLQRLFAGLPVSEQEQFFEYLDLLATGPAVAADGSSVILFSADKLIRECVQAACGSNFRCATDDPDALDLVVDQSLSKGVVPLLLLDSGEPGKRVGYPERVLALVRQKREKYPEMGIFLLACPGDFRLGIQALKEGVRAVVPRSSREERLESYLSDSIDCTEALIQQLKEAGKAAWRQPAQGAPQAALPGEGVPEPALIALVRDQFLALAQQREPAEVTFRLMQAVAAIFGRALTLVVVRSELIAERGIGIEGAGVTASVKLRLPLGGDSLFQQALNRGESYLGEPDLALREGLYPAIGAPAGASTAFLLPLQSFGRVIALIYADFGEREAGSLQRELPEMLALHAGVVIDNALYRKRAAQRPGTAKE